jgi:hypothetical protein
MAIRIQRQKAPELMERWRRCNERVPGGTVPILALSGDGFPGNLLLIHEAHLAALVDRQDEVCSRLRRRCASAPC